MCRFRQIVVCVSVLLFVFCISSPAQVFPPEFIPGPFPTGTETVRNDAPFDELGLSDIIHEYTCYIGQPVVDGIIDGDEVWESIPYTLFDWYQIGATEFSALDGFGDYYDGPYDKTAWFKMLWNGDNLIYLAVKSVDDIHYAEDTGTVWNNDCIQMGFHTRDPLETGATEGGTGAGPNLSFVADTIYYHRPISSSHAFAHDQLLLADGDNFYYFVNDNVIQENKAVYCTIDDTNPDSVVMTWEMAFDLSTGALYDEFYAGLVGRFSIMSMDKEDVDDFVFQAVSWTKGIVTSKNMDHFGSVLFSENAPPASAVDSQMTSQPEAFALKQNYPNPFNSETFIEFSVPKKSPVHLAIYNPLGQPVATLVEKEMDGGTHQVRWDASDLPSGLYFCTLNINGLVQTVKMSLLK